MNNWILLIITAALTLTAGFVSILPKCISFQTGYINSSSVCLKYQNAFALPLSLVIFAVSQAFLLKWMLNEGEK